MKGLDLLHEFAKIAASQGKGPHGYPYLSKPFKISVMLELVDRYFNDRLDK